MTISFFILNLFNALAEVYAASKLFKEQLNFKNKKIYLVLLILSLYTFLSYSITKSILRIVILFQIYNGCNIYLFHNENNDIPKITYVSLFCSIILLFCEVAVALAVNLVFYYFIGIDKLNYFTDFLAYVVIFTFLILISIKKVQGALIKIVNLFNNFKSYTILFATIYVFLIFSTILYLIYFNLSQTIKFILLFLALIEYVYLVFIIVVSYKNKEKVQKDLDLMLEVTSKYENVINDIRTKNHENRNQLIVIKDLIVSDNKKAISYIDSMLKVEHNEDEELILKVSNIPVGGLKGLIYYKLLTMKSKNIESCINISKNISKNIFSDMNESIMQSYYKIIGVFLDNAIDAAEKQDKKIILIEMFIENENLIFSISNEFKGNIDFENLGKKRITTKGSNHGYGLQLVRELVDKYDKLFNQTEVIGDLFVQKVGIKIKGIK